MNEQVSEEVPFTSVRGFVTAMVLVYEALMWLVNFICALAWTMFLLVMASKTLKLEVRA